MTRNTYHLPSVCFRVLLVKSVVFLCVLFTVMNDIISTMFNQRFMENLFRPQEIYSKKGMRTVFDRLAHASIMRLNTASMDKVCTHYFPIRPDTSCRHVRFADDFYFSIPSFSGVQLFSHFCHSGNVFLFFFIHHRSSSK